MFVNNLFQDYCLSFMVIENSRDSSLVVLKFQSLSLFLFLFFFLLLSKRKINNSFMIWGKE